MNVIERSERERLIAWEDPKVLAKSGAAMSGRAFLDAMRTGELPHPPVAQLIGFKIDEVDDGRVVLSMQANESHYNPNGVVHGGVIATLLDSAMGLSIHSMLPVGRLNTTLEIKVNYLRAVTIEAGPIRVAGRVIHCGRQTAVSEASIMDAAGKLYAQASTTCLLFDAPKQKTE